jgi:hypothetical protein
MKTTKTIFTALLIAALALAARAQVGESAGNIAIAVAVPQQIDHLDASQRMRLGKKMFDLVTHSGMSATGEGAEVMMMPLFSIESEDLVEGGMKNLTVVTADVTFLIRQVETDKVFASVSRQIKGAGTDRQKAIGDAISKISPTDAALRKFIAEGREKITDYYSTSCKSIVAKAESCAKQLKYGQAIALLSSIPEAVTCFEHAQRKAQDIYVAYQNQRCEELLQQAQALYGGHFYVPALALLASFEQFNTRCSADAKALIRTIEGKISESEKREFDREKQAWEFVAKQQSDKTMLESQRISAIQEVATAYYKQKIEEHYTLIVK